MPRDHVLFEPPAEQSPCELRSTIEFVEFVDEGRKGRRAELALNQLTPRQREVVVLRAIDQEPVAMVAARLHCSIGTVKATYHTALTRLRAHLTTGSEDEIPGTC